MVSSLDQSVGRVVDALQKAKLLENSIILFISDNGAQTEGFLENYGSNYPLRGVIRTYSFLFLFRFLVFDEFFNLSISIIR